MHPARLAARAAAAQAPLLAAMAALVLVVTGILTGIPRYLDSAEVASARATLAEADPLDAAVRAEVRLAQDAAAQARAMDAVLAPLVSDTDVMVVRSVQSDAVTTRLGDGTEAGILFSADPTAIDRIDVVAGEWPADGAAVQASAAEALGVQLGDTLVASGTELPVVALWVPTDASDPAWFGDEAVASGQSSSAWGPVLLDESALAALDVNPFVRWTLLPDLDRLDATGIAPLGRAAEDWEAAIREDAELSAGGVVFAGGLAATVATIERGIASVRGVSPLPLVVAAVVGGIAFLQLARLLLSARASETLLLRTRGRSTAGTARSTAIEGAAVSLPAAALGALTASLLVPGATAVLPVVVAAGVSGASVVIVALVAALAAHNARAPQRAAVGGYLAALALAVIAAVVCVWQFRLYGSPVVTTAAGEVLVDPLAVLAAPLALLACAIAAVAVLPAVFAGVERAASRCDSLGPAFVARQIARRPGAFAVPVMLTTLAVASLVVASAYSATWDAATVRAGELRNGADVRVGLATSSTVGGAASITSSPPFAVAGSRATPVLVAETEAGDDAVSLVAIAGTELDIMTTAGGTVDRAVLDRAIASAPVGLELDSTATSVAVTVTTTVEPLVPGAPLTPTQGATSAAVWVADAQGALARLALDPEGEGLAAALPDGVAPWSVLAVDTTVTTGPTPASYRVAITFSDMPTPSGWAVQADAGTELDDGPEAHSALGYSFAVDEPTAPVLVRLMPSGGVAALAITSAFADRLGVDVGDDVRLRFAGSGLALDGVVGAVVPLLPGSASSLAALVDLRALNSAVLRVTSSVPKPREIWIAATDPVAVAAALAPDRPSGARITTMSSGSGEALQRPVVAALWVGALGALLLAAAATAAVSLALLRSRRSEVVALRALGVRDGAHARGRAWELVLVVALAVVAGLLAGYGVALLTVRDLARSAVLDAPRTLDAPVLLDVPRLGAALGAFALAILVIVAFGGLRVRRQAAASTGREVDA